MLKEDHWCYPPAIAFGLSEPSEFLLQRNTFVKFTVDDAKAARKLAEAFPRRVYGKYIGVLSVPLNSSSSAPDVVVSSLWKPGGTLLRQ